ncbi:MAG: hypothetical protein MUP09_02720 [Thiovulaceae bacterium]|nr:hypothetical protein [Sulfurimonadaceae bacterium]
MKKMGLLALLFSAALFMSLGVTSVMAEDAEDTGSSMSSAEKEDMTTSKCSAEKKAKDASKCNAETKAMNAGKCNTEKKEKAEKCGAGKCGDSE